MPISGLSLSPSREYYMSEDLQIQTTDEIVAPIEETITETPAEEIKEAEAPKTFTEEEVKAREDALAAKLRNKFERKQERAKIELETRQQIEAESKVVNKAEKLDPAKFESWDAYQDALLDQKVEQRLQRRESETVAQQKERIAKAEVERVETLSQTMMEKGNEKYGDMDDILESIGDNLKAKDAGFSEAGRMAILESELSADILNHFYKNPDEAVRIANLSEYGQAKEIGKLELSLEKPAKITKAPTPISPIDGTRTLTKKLEDMTYEEMLAHDAKRGAKYLGLRA